MRRFDMKKILAIFLGISALGVLFPTSAQELTGETRLACEAILCLSSGTRPTECTPSLRHYFGISKRRFTDTIRARTNFLKLCPVSNQTPEMQSLVNALGRGSGRCGASDLNQAQAYWCEDDSQCIRDSMPSYCRAVYGHGYTDFVEYQPRYVGTPVTGGFWVEAKDYEQALAEYNRKNQTRVLRGY